MDDKQGKWVTINGTHIFIKDGQTVEEAMAERQVKHDNLTKALSDRVDVAQLDPRNLYYLGGNKVSQREYARYVFRQAIENRAKDEDLILTALNNHIDKVILKDTRGSHNDWLNGERRLVVSIAGTGPEICTTFFHEVGHAIDFDRRNYMSSTFVSSKYGVTMQDMLKQEFQSNLDVELLKDEFGRFDDLSKKLSIDYQADRVSRQEYFQQNAYLAKAETDFVDMIQGIYGNDVAMQVGGWLPHKESYFTKVNGALGTECFAELTESLQADSKQTFYKLIKDYCPKTVEIYEEIMEERRKQWKVK